MCDGGEAAMCLVFSITKDTKGLANTNRDEVSRLSHLEEEVNDQWTFSKLNVITSL